MISALNAASVKIFTKISEEMRNSRDDWRIAFKKPPEGGSAIEGIAFGSTRDLALSCSIVVYFEPAGPCNAIVSWPLLMVCLFLNAPGIETYLFLGLRSQIQNEIRVAMKVSCYYLLVFNDSF